MSCSPSSCSCSMLTNNARASSDNAMVLPEGESKVSGTVPPVHGSYLCTCKTQGASRVPCLCFARCFAALYGGYCDLSWTSLNTTIVIICAPRWPRPKTAKDHIIPLASWNVRYCSLCLSALPGASPSPLAISCSSSPAVEVPNNRPTTDPQAN